MRTTYRLFSYCIFVERSGNRNLTGVRRPGAGRLRFQLGVRQAEIPQVRQRVRAERRAETDQGLVAETEPRQR